MYIYEKENIRLTKNFRKRYNIYVMGKPGEETKEQKRYIK